MKNFLITVLGVLVGALLLGGIFFSFGWIELPSTPSDSTGSDSTGSDSTGNDSTGSDSTGSDSTGSDSTGSDSTGSDSTGSDSTGSDSTGSDSTGSDTTTPGTIIAKSGLNHAFTVYNGESTFTIDCYSVAFVMDMGNDSEDSSVYYGFAPLGDWIVDEGGERPDYVCYHIRASESAVAQMNEYLSEAAGGSVDKSWTTNEYESSTDSGDDDFYTILKRVAGLNDNGILWTAAVDKVFFCGDYSFLLDVYAGYNDSGEQLVATIPFGAKAFS